MSDPETTVELRFPGKRPGGRSAGTPPPPHPAASGAPRSRRRWPWLAVGLVVGLVLGVGGGYLALLRGQPVSDRLRDVAVLTYGAGGDLARFEVTESSCLLVAPATGHPIGTGQTHDCAQPHDSQVFRAIAPFREDVPNAFPDPVVLRDFGRAQCLLQFDTVVTGADRSDLTLTTVVPTEAGYQALTPAAGGVPASYRGRDVYCVLNAPSGRQIEGTRMISR